MLHVLWFFMVFFCFVLSCHHFAPCYQMCNSGGSILLSSSFAYNQIYLAITCHITSFTMVSSSCKLLMCLTACMMICMASCVCVCIVSLNTTEKSLALFPFLLCPLPQVFTCCQVWIHYDGWLDYTETVLINSRCTYVKYNQEFPSTLREYADFSTFMKDDF